jgi:hypothetical protein
MIHPFGFHPVLLCGLDPAPARIRGGIGMQSAQAPLNFRSDPLAFLVNRHTLRGQDLPVF